MLLLLDLITACVGLTLLYQEAIRNRFLNYATSVFLLAFVPLLCVYPLIARIFVGGAYSVAPGSDIVIGDPWVYVLYQVFCLTILIVIYVSMRRQISELPYVGWRIKYQADPIEIYVLTALIGLGVALFVRATGYSFFELLSASRFEWVDDPNFSSVTLLISTYLMALSPVAILLALQRKQDRLVLAAIVAFLVLYGILVRDRKWVIFIMSAGFAYTYIRNGYSIRISRKAAAIVLVVVTALAFWQIARSVLFDYYLTGSGDPIYESEQVAQRLLTKGDFPYYYNASIMAIDMNINDHFYIPFGILRRQLFFFVPANFSFGLKVDDLSAIFSDAIGGGDALRRGNMPPGFFGLFIISFGWIGTLVACCLIPLGLRALDRFIHRNRGIASVVVAAHMLSSVTLLLRGDDSSATYFIISSFAVLFVVRIFLGSRPSAQPPAQAPSNSSGETMGVKA